MCKSMFESKLLPQNLVLKKQNLEYFYKLSLKTSIQTSTKLPDKVKYHLTAFQILVMVENLIYLKKYMAA